jgi:hypothetical protein
VYIFINNDCSYQVISDDSMYPRSPCVLNPDQYLTGMEVKMAKSTVYNAKITLLAMPGTAN